MRPEERTFVAIKPDGVKRGLIGRILSRFEEIARFCANKSIEAMLNLESVIFSIVALKELKKDLMLSRVSCENRTCSFCSCSTVTFACFSAVSDLTQDDVSSPDAKPLNDIDILSLPCS